MVDHRKSTLARGSRYVTVNGVRNGLEWGVVGVGLGGWVGAVGVGVSGGEGGGGEEQVMSRQVGCGRDSRLGKGGGGSPSG